LAIPTDFDGSIFLAPAATKNISLIAIHLIAKNFNFIEI